MVSWLLLAIFRAARAAYTVVNWMLLGCAGGGVDTTELLKCGGSWVCRSVASRRSGSNIHSVSLLGVATLYCAGSCCLLGGSLESVVSGDFASGCLHAVGFVGVMLKWAASVCASGQHLSVPQVSSSRPPIMRPGTAPGRATAAGVASCTRLAIRVSRQWRGWQLAPAKYATWDSTRAGSIR